VTEYSDETWQKIHKKYRSKSGETLLHLYAKKGEIEMMKLFLRIGVDVSELTLGSLRELRPALAGRSSRSVPSVSSGTITLSMRLWQC
jgi:hypothetical protein